MLSQARNHTPEQSPPLTNQDHTAWISAALSKMQTIKVGMSRAELTTVFATERRTLNNLPANVPLSPMPYIKVDVTFAASSREEELLTDKIVRVSRPYLAWLVMD